MTPPARRVLAALLLSLLSSSLAVNLVFDEVLWTKSIWATAKVGNMLLHTNPSDQDPKLQEVYPSIKGTIANSLDGPNERRDGSKPPQDPDMEGFNLNGLETIEDADVKPAAAAAQCAVCHVLSAHVWQNLTEAAVDALVVERLSAARVRKRLMEPHAVKKQLEEVCKKEAGEYLLARQSILKLGEPTANVLFFVIRDRKKGMPATTAEHKAVRTACKKLVQDSGDEMVSSLSEIMSVFLSQVEMALKQHQLLEAADAKEASSGAGGSSEGSSDAESSDDGGADAGEEGVAAAAADSAAAAGGAKTAAGGTDGVVPATATAAAAAGAAAPRHALLVASLVKEVLRKAWPTPGVPAPGAAAAAAATAAAASAALPSEDDEYEDDDIDALDPDCMDLHPLCLSWADKGECEANPVYMVGAGAQKGHCRKSCGVCTPRKRGERGNVGLMDSSEIKAKHPLLVGKLENLVKPLQQALANRACGASKACLTGVAGTAIGTGFTPGTVTHQQGQSQGWQLQKPHYGQAQMERLSAKDLKELEASLVGHATAEAGSLAAEVNEALGAELKGKVLTVNGDFFTYEYVYKNHTRHYHIDHSGQYTEDYMLGSFLRESVNVINAATGTAATLDERDLLPSARALLLQKEWPYVKQVYAGGDECVLGGGRRVVRKTEARIACSPDKNTHMLVREPDFCQYVFVIYTPALCKVERFQPTLRDKGERKEGKGEEEEEDEYL